MNVRTLFFRQRRFDVIFKYLYARDGGRGFAREAYLESIRRFNGFEEFDADGQLVKSGAEAFTSAFDDLIASLRNNGFRSDLGAIPLDAAGNIANGAHRLAAAFYLGIDEVETAPAVGPELFDWKFFADTKMDPVMMDWAALEYVKLNPSAHIVNLHSVADPSRDDEVLAILGKYGFVFYGKSIRLSLNGCVNLKKLSYGSFWERANWIGDAKDGFSGAREHARESMQGGNPLRVFVFVCDRLEDVVRAKSEIRDLYQVGNVAVHINDTHEEAVWLAETYFNANSLRMNDLRPFRFEDTRFDAHIDELRALAKERGVDPNALIGAGSTPLNVLGLRRSDDFDFLSVSDRMDIHTETFSPHDSQLAYYPASKDRLVDDPRLHFYYRGLKFISLDVLMRMKQMRHEVPKDVDDVRLIESAMNGDPARGLRNFRERMRRLRDWVYSKDRIGANREVTLLGFKFTYVSRRRREKLRRES